MSLHAEVLPREQEHALRLLGPAATECGFYLAGGTAVAIHLGHRQSLDFDWFTNERLENPLEISRQIQRHGVDFRVASVQRGTIHGDLDGVRVSFLEFGYPLLTPPVAWSAFHCSIASLEDLAAMKLLAVAQRGTKKDFLDVCALGHAMSLAEMLALYQRKFDVKDIARVIYSLCYFDDADSEPMPSMLDDLTWEQAKEQIRNWVKSRTESPAGD